MVTHDYLMDNNFKFRRLYGANENSTAGEYTRDDLHFLMRLYKYDDEPDKFINWEVTIITKFRTLSFKSKCPNKELTIDNLNLLIRLISD